MCASAATGNSFYAMLPATTLLTIRILDALMIYFNIRPNPYMEKVFLKRSTAVVPDAKGELAAPGSERIAVLLLGAKTNHPFGVLDPEFLKFSLWLTKMTEQFDKESERPHGCKFERWNPSIKCYKLMSLKQSLAKPIGIVKMSVAPPNSPSSPIGETLRTYMRLRTAHFIERLGDGGKRRSNGIMQLALTTKYLKLIQVTGRMSISIFNPPGLEQQLICGRKMGI